MVSLVAGVAQQHVLGVVAAATEPAVGVEDGLGPQHTVVERNEVQHDLRKAAALHQGSLPAPERIKLQRELAVFQALFLIIAWGGEQCTNCP